MEIRCRNVNDAYKTLIERMKCGDISTEVGPSRDGEVCIIEEPLSVYYSHPKERVLLCKYRDANPFFHLYEALHMLAGRSEIQPLEYYSKSYAKQVRDGISPQANGAYGRRWRRFYNTFTSEYVDQIELIIDHLKQNPWSRRAVLQMWNVKEDLLNIERSKDVCCNLSVLFSVEKGVCGRRGESDHCSHCGGSPHEIPKYLNMTVLNRSNDIFWGMLGANYVQFTILQEYISHSLNLELGRYVQFTNNAHYYTERFSVNDIRLSEDEPYSQSVPLVFNKKKFDAELIRLLNEYCSHRQNTGRSILDLTEPFFIGVASPMFMAYRAYRQKMYDDSFSHLEQVKDNNWKRSCTNWIEKRIRGTDSNKSEVKEAPSLEEYDPDMSV